MSATTAPPGRAMSGLGVLDRLRWHPFIVRRRASLGFLLGNLGPASEFSAWLGERLAAILLVVVLVTLAIPGLALFMTTTTHSVSTETVSVTGVLAPYTFEPPGKPYGVHASDGYNYYFASDPGLAPGSTFQVELDQDGRFVAMTVNGQRIASSSTGVGGPIALVALIAVAVVLAALLAIITLVVLMGLLSTRSRAADRAEGPTAVLRGAYVGSWTPRLLEWRAAFVAALPTVAAAGFPLVVADPASGEHWLVMSLDRLRALREIEATLPPGSRSVVVRYYPRTRIVDELAFEDGRSISQAAVNELLPAGLNLARRTAGGRGRLTD